MKLINKVYQVPERKLSEIEIKNKAELIEQSELRAKNSRKPKDKKRWVLYERFFKK